MTEKQSVAQRVSVKDIETEIQMSLWEGALAGNNTPMALPEILQIAVDYVYEKQSREAREILAEQPEPECPEMEIHTEGLRNMAARLGLDLEDEASND